MKKHRKEKKRKHHKSKKRKDVTSSETSSSEEWVESVPLSQTLPKQQDNWLDLPDTFVPTFDKDRTHRREKKEKEERRSQLSLDQPGSHSRELNPYWKDGGKGLPQESVHVHQVSLPKHAVGDGGLSWLRKAYQRVKEQSEEEGRSMDEVAAQTWGSLKNLEALLQQAEEHAFGAHHSQELQEARRRSRKHSQDGSNKSSRTANPTVVSVQLQSLGRCGTSSRSTGREASPPPLSGSKRHGFQKPNDEEDHDHSRRESSTHLALTKGNWLKKKTEIIETNPTEKTIPQEEDTTGQDAEKDASAEASRFQPSTSTAFSTLSDRELNELGAKLLKAELTGNKQLAEKLRNRMDEAQRLKQSSAEPQHKSYAASETVILTRTDHRGFTFPLKMPEKAQGDSSHRKKGASRKHGHHTFEETKYSLKEMFEREMMTTAEDNDNVFIKLAGKVSGRTGDEYDMDDGDAHRNMLKETECHRKERERSKAIKEHQHLEKSVEHCYLCLDNTYSKKHLIISMAARSYLCLPSCESLTEGTCLIVPVAHVSAVTLLDEDVWQEMQMFRKCVTRMFSDQQKDVVFLETSMYLRKHRHTFIECIPVPKDIGDFAPLYFKKAILESESEWAQNRPLIDLSKKDIRHSVPKGLPYFSVDFGLEGGFAHVIEDEKKFPAYFGKEIIGGMLDSEEPRLWRKPRHESYDYQKKKVLKFTAMWKPYDWTKESGT